MDPISTPQINAASTTSTPLHEDLAYAETPTEPAVSHFDTTLEPEHKLPGSFPKSSQDTTRSKQDVLASAKEYIPSQQDVQNTLQSARDTAAPYIQNVQATLQSAGEAARPYVESTLQSAKPYLPGSVSERLPGSAQSQLPSKETPGGSGVGVGSLPGTNSETSVAKLPDERGLDSSHSLNGSNLPSTEVPGISRGGVGSLPGINSEAGVAKLPEERAQEGNQSSTGVLGAAQQSLSNAGQTAKQYVPEVVASRIPQPSLSNAGQNAKDYLPSTTGTGLPTQQTLSNAGQTAKEYLPETLATRLPGSQPQTQTTLPSTETPGGSRVGVGSLPGTISEISVAKLPEERRQENLPSHETGPEILGKTGGVGSLPGGPNESRVAVLPDERRQENAPPQGLGHTTLGGPGATGTRLTEGGARPTKDTAEKKVEPPKDDPAPAVSFAGKNDKKSESSQDKGITEDTVKEKRPDPSYGSGYHPAELHPLNASSESHKEAKSSNGSQSGAKNSADQQQHASPTGEHHKVGFMSKIKGEAKVIAGKLGHDEQKVEQGKHMMGK